MDDETIVKYQRILTPDQFELFYILSDTPEQLITWDDLKTIFPKLERQRIHNLVSQLRKVFENRNWNYSIENKDGDGYIFHAIGENNVSEKQ
jgi:hypothetical protein